MICTLHIDEPRFEAFENLNAFLENIALHVFKALNVKETYEISFLLTGNDHIQKLNAEFRGKDKPTNVLSFPAPKQGVLPEGVPQQLGDIALCYEVIEEEASAQNKTFKDHFTHLVIHGILHLIGYDHEAEEDATIMENLEIQLLEQLSIANPYEG